jgi:hypothetical protein
MARNRIQQEERAGDVAELLRRDAHVLHQRHPDNAQNRLVGKVHHHEYKQQGHYCVLSEFGSHLVYSRVCLLFTAAASVASPCAPADTAGVFICANTS